MSVKDLLRQEVENQIESLEDIPYGSPEHKQAVEDTSKLLDKLIEMEKNEVDHQDKLVAMKDERIDRIVKNCLTGVSVVGGFAITVWGTIKSIKFEETGTITTIMGRNFINKLLHK